MSEAVEYAYTQNRELSWLSFDQRVLEEACDRTVPTLERLKFLSIFSSNLDEFFMVRVGSLYDVSLISPEERDNKSGMTAQQQLRQIYQTIPGLIELKKQIYASVMSDLNRVGISDLQYSQLRPEEAEYVSQFYKTGISPVLSPLIIGSHHPAPHLANKRLYIAALLRDKKGRNAIGLIPTPDSVAAYVKLPGSDLRFIRTETLIQHFSGTLFGAYEVAESCVISVTRNADLSFDGEKFEDSDIDFRSQVSKLLKKRDHLSPVRLEISRPICADFLERLTALVKVGRHQIYFDSCPLNMKYVFSLPGEISPQKQQTLLYPPYTPRWPEDISREHSVIEQIQSHDLLLFYPFDSVDPFLKLLSEAAERPDVISIKITIYRLASSSKIARMLCRAAENGKEVIVLMELRARFDEANNITWSKLLEDSGCQVVYGIEDYKCHSKICLITMKNRGRLSYITQIGTGNYNEKTNAQYTDLSIMTADQTIGEDGTVFFQNMLVNNLAGEYRQLLVAPTGIRPAIFRLIDEQIALGTDGYICMKVNSVTERQIIDKLMEASRAGVEIQLIVRGICCILPGVPTYTDNLHVTSIVGRYLEHARIYCFGKGPGAKLYISSADLMTRNQLRRVEIACPVHDPERKEQLMWILNCQLKDNAKASFLMSNGKYSRKIGQLYNTFDCQQHFMDCSIHAETTFVPAKRRLTNSLGGQLRQLVRRLRP
ncbi:MAG: polyphosphate kinase 1 [Eubacteriales bacterium]|nr:polyphosphate kinase 1 [Eubacteriales bacterium]